jgi:hypothetical protein
MGSITIHDLDTALDRRLTEEAGRAHKSKNQFIKEVLARALGLPVAGRFGDEYREFCGAWDVAEREAFDAVQAGYEQVDPEDWRP